MIILPARILGLLTQKLTDAPQHIADVPARIADKAERLVDAAATAAHVVTGKVVKKIATVATFDPLSTLTAWKAVALHWAGTTSLYGVAVFAAWFALRWTLQRVRQHQSATWLRWRVAGMPADKLAEMLRANGLKAMSGGGQTLLVNAYHSGAVRRILSGMNIVIMEAK